MEPITIDMLDDDLYKLSMMQAAYHQYPNAMVRYDFKCRNKDVKLGFLADKVREQIDFLADLKFDADSVQYLFSLGYFHNDFCDFLEYKYRLDPSTVTVSADSEGDLVISIYGRWYEVIMFEVKTLAIVNELYFRETTNFEEIEEIGFSRLQSKVYLLKEYPTLKFAEFGTRRRYSASWQRKVTTYLRDNCPDNLVGTSNIALARHLGIKPIGTVAHEWFSAHLALVDRLSLAQKRAMHVWQQEYGEALGTMLTDTFTTPAFFSDFDVVLARAVAGLRHDSGDPIKFGNSAIRHYEKLKIDPRTKMLVFSDGLDIPEAIRIFKQFAGRIGVSFGIGTNLTNDLGPKALNIVIKLLQCNGIPVVKLSDVASKNMGDPEMIIETKKAFKVTL